MDPLLRVIDANLNRSREALRVIEDFARFVRNDRDVARRAKEARHRVAAIVHAIGANELLNARNIESDVGRDSKTASELARGDAEDVVRAAFARLSEALRSVGEFAKVESPNAATLAESLRYDAYALETALLSRGERRARFASVRLYVIVTEALCRRGWIETAEAALRGGATCLQIREKTLGDRELLRRARLLRELCGKHGALFIVNDRPDIALSSDADGVHLGQDDLPLTEARRILGGDRLIGLSTHDAEQFHAAVAQRPDYVAFGPLFESPTKPQPQVPGVAGFAPLRSLTNLPLVGIGGITAVRAGEVRRAGVDVLCACSAVIAATDPERAAAELCGKV